MKFNSSSTGGLRFTCSNRGVLRVTDLLVLLMLVLMKIRLSLVSLRSEMNLLLIL